MKNKTFGIVGGIAFLLLANSVYAGDPKPPVKYLAHGGCTFISTDITFDGVNFASELNCAGSDNFGLFESQGIEAFSNCSTTCTAPDGSPGEECGVLEFETSASTYSLFGDQVFSNSFTGSVCINFAHNITGETRTYNITGGTGRFKGATGTITTTIVGSFLYLGFAPPQTGHFGRYTFTDTGSITIIP